VVARGSDGHNICLVNVGGYDTGIELRSDSNSMRLSTIGTAPDGDGDQPNVAAVLRITGSRNSIGGDPGLVRVRRRPLVVRCGWVS
jgi:hypothetical protein